jgi:Protein of unknown function (DUF2026)
VDEPDLHSAVLISLGHTNDRSARDKYHCWIECEGWVIDFMAPVVREALAIAGNDIAISRRMFQKQRSLMCASQSELAKDGDFHFERNWELTESLVSGFSMKPVSVDLVNICLDWYKRPPEQIKSQIEIVDDLKKIKHVKFTDMHVEEVSVI